jgi:hypothetical protein
MQFPRRIVDLNTKRNYWLTKYSSSQTEERHNAAKSLEHADNCLQLRPDHVGIEEAQSNDHSHYVDRQ